MMEPERALANRQYILSHETERMAVETYINMPEPVNGTKKRPFKTDLALKKYRVKIS